MTKNVEKEKKEQDKRYSAVVYRADGSIIRD